MARYGAREYDNSFLEVVTFDTAEAVFVEVVRTTNWSNPTR